MDELDFFQKLYITFMGLGALAIGLPMYIMLPMLIFETMTAIMQNIQAVFSLSRYQERRKYREYREYRTYLNSKNSAKVDGLALYQNIFFTIFFIVVGGYANFIGYTFLAMVFGFDYLPFCFWGSEVLCETLN